MRINMQYYITPYITEYNYIIQNKQIQTQICIGSALFFLFLQSSQEMFTGYPVETCDVHWDWDPTIRNNES